MDEAAEVPFAASIDCGLVVVDSADIASALFVGHGPVLVGFFLAAAVPQAPASPVAIPAPLV